MNRRILAMFKCDPPSFRDFKCFRLWYAVQMTVGAKALWALLSPVCTMGAAFG
jgi:hypothetical protein